MKLICSIRARRDGTVIFTHAGREWIFAPTGRSAQLVCDVVDEGAARAMLDTGNFYPADDAGEEKARTLLERIKTRAAPRGAKKPSAAPQAKGATA